MKPKFLKCTFSLVYILEFLTCLLKIHVLPDRILSGVHTHDYLIQ